MHHITLVTLLLLMLRCSCCCLAAAEAAAPPPASCARQSCAGTCERKRIASDSALRAIAHCERQRVESKRFESVLRALNALSVSTTPATISVRAQQRGRQRWQRGLAARTGDRQREDRQRGTAARGTAASTAPRAEEILRESGHKCEGAERASCNCARLFSHAWQKSQVGAELQRARQRATKRAG